MSSSPEEQRIFEYNKGEINKIAKVIRKLGDEAKEQARQISSDLVDFAVSEIKTAANSHPRPKQAKRIAEGVRISKSSVVGEFGLGFASQRFSGGATTQLNEGKSAGQLGILAGVEFGARRQKQFLTRTPRFGLRGNTGTFIWPTLRRIQPDLIAKWEQRFDIIAKEWDK
jgi:hypothetical protein